MSEYTCLAVPAPWLCCSRGNPRVVLQIAYPVTPVPQAVHLQEGGSHEAEENHWQWYQQGQCYSLSALLSACPPVPVCVCLLKLKEFIDSSATSWYNLPTALSACMPLCLSVHVRIWRNSLTLLSARSVAKVVAHFPVPLLLSGILCLVKWDKYIQPSTAFINCPEDSSVHILPLLAKSPPHHLTFFCKLVSWLAVVCEYVCVCVCMYICVHVCVCVIGCVSWAHCLLSCLWLLFCYLYFPSLNGIFLFSCTVHQALVYNRGLSSISISLLVFITTCLQYNLPTVLSAWLQACLCDEAGEFFFFIDTVTS